MEERAPGNSTRGHRWDLSQPYLSSFKSLLGAGCSLARAPHIPLFLQAAMPEVVLQGWALQFLCCCSSFVLHVSECCCWVGWGLDNPTCSSSSLGSKLSLTINGKPLQEEKAWQTQNKLWRYSVTLYASWSFSKHRGLHVQAVSTLGIQTGSKGSTKSF